MTNEFFKEFKNFNDWHLAIHHDLNSRELYLHDFEILSKHYYPEFVKLMDKMANACEGFIDDTKEKTRDYIRKSEMYKIIQEANWIYQIIAKPYGYAGDFELMQIIYRDTFEGKSNFGKLYGKLTNSVEGSQAVRNRKILLKSEIEKFSDGNILSVAAGPAEEIKEVINEKHRPNLNFYALDHDINTIKKTLVSEDYSQLKYAITNVFNIIKGDFTILFPKQKRLEHLVPKNDLKGLNIITAPFKYKFDKLNKYRFNLIYSAGLYDYLKTFNQKSKGTIGLTKKLFNLLESDGSLIIGNYNPSIPRGTRWHLEYICDWNLIYRNDNEILEFISDINPKEIRDARIIKEETGINSFLIVDKK